MFYLHWTYWWFDWLMHSLTAFTGGLGLYWGLFLSGIIFRNEPDNRFWSEFAVFVLVLLIGVGWEVFEYLNGITDSYEAVYAVDVATDLLANSIGAILAVLIGARRAPSITLLPQ